MGAAVSPISSFTCADENPLHQVTVFVDASETGYGGYCGSHTVAGVLPTDVIGTSSTLRELCGVRLLTEELAERLQNKRVKYVLDSQPAIANLIKGGGDKSSLNDAIKEWWRICQRLSITPSYEWVPRENNKDADKLSKANEYDVTRLTDAAHAIAIRSLSSTMFRMVLSIVLYEGVRYDDNPCSDAN